MDDDLRKAKKQIKELKSKLKISKKELKTSERLLLFAGKKIRGLECPLDHSTLRSLRLGSEDRLSDTICPECDCDIREGD